MEVKKVFVRNYLTKGHYKWAFETAMLILSLCLIASFYHWNSLVDISATYDMVFESKEYWRLFSTTFVHANIHHFMSNALMLGILSFFVSSFYGPIFTLITSFFMAVATNGLVLYAYGAKSGLVGASGVVFFLWGFWMVLFMFLQRQTPLFRRILKMGTVFLVLLVPTQYDPNTSYLAHYLGYAIGVFSGLVYYILRKDRLHAHEVWETQIIEDELSELDMIALSHPRE
jgi:rhomboid protease GluP